MKEEFVSYSEAVALRECGFDWECGHYYFHSADGTIYLKANIYGDCQNVNSVGKSYSSAPTQALAQKWLREVHKLSVEPTSNVAGQWNVSVSIIIVCGETLWSKIGFDTYEAALSAGLDATIDLIKQK